MTAVSLPAEFYARPPQEVAPELLGKVLQTSSAAGRIVEVEAYDGSDDPGSHAYRGPTPRTEVMFGPPGHLYVYFSYGMHWCANVVCRDEGSAAAVLIRALSPMKGQAVMYERRPAAVRERDLCSGPAKLCAALASTTAAPSRRPTPRCRSSMTGLARSARPFKRSGWV